MLNINIINIAGGGWEGGEKEGREET